MAAKPCSLTPLPDSTSCGHRPVRRANSAAPTRNGDPTTDAFDRVDDEPLTDASRSYIEQMSRKPLREADPKVIEDLQRKVREQREREHPKQGVQSVLHGYRVPKKLDAVASQ